MGKSSPKPPPAPDYAAAATAQGQANIDAAKLGAVLSNPNIVSPYGNQTVTWGAADPNNPGGAQQATVTQTLTPEAQAALTAQQKTQAALGDLAQQGVGQAQKILGTPFEFNGPQVSAEGPEAGAITSGPAADAYGLAKGDLDLADVANMPVNAGMTGQAAILSRLTPQIEQSGKALTQQLANQGITPGSEAWTAAMRDQGQRANDLYTQAALQGINLDMAANDQGFGQAMSKAGLYNSAVGQNYGQGVTSANLQNAAQNQAFNQDLQTKQFQNNASNQALAQQLALYNQPLNQITALMSGSQIENPQFQQYQGQNVAAAPVFAATQAQGQYDQNAYAQRVAAQNANASGLYGLAGAGLMALSDERLKSNVERVGTHPLGIGVYEYDIFDRRERGVMAQELQRVKPEAVFQHPSGFLMVDYGQL